MDRSADRDVKIKLQFVRGQLEKGRIIQVYVMDTGRIGALTSPQYFSHAMQTYFPHAVCAEPDSKAPRASSIMARIREGVTDLATVAVVQGATWPWGVRYRAPSSLFHILASRCKEATRQRRRWTSRHGRTLLDIHSSDR